MNIQFLHNCFISHAHITADPWENSFQILIDHTKLCSLFCFPEQSCNSSFFMCKNGKCIPQRDVCDNKEDCSDGSDEKSCHINECLSKKVSGCSQDCQDLLVGYKVNNYKMWCNIMQILN